jgi:hypothetical protein
LRNRFWSAHYPLKVVQPGYGSSTRFFSAKNLDNKPDLRFIFYKTIHKYSVIVNRRVIFIPSKYPPIKTNVNAEKMLWRKIFFAKCPFFE